MQNYDGLLHERSAQAALIERAKRGDEAAFDVLYERHAASAWRLAYALTGTARDSVSVVSESFARTFTALRAGHGSAGEFPTLLLRTVRHHAIDARRAHGETAAPFEASEQTVVLATAFASLPERWRAALWLREVEDLDNDDLASVIELDGDETTKVLGRGRKGLREQFLHADVHRSDDRNCGRAISRLGAYASGSLPGADIDKLERHLGLCATCTDRQARLVSLFEELPLLVPALPSMLADDVRIAWAGAVATPSGRGLSRMGEKVLAGVAAVAAGVGVLGAALVTATGSGNGDDQAVAPFAPIVTELATPRPPELNLAIDLDPNRSLRSSPDAEFDGVVGASARDDQKVVFADIGEDQSDGGDATPISGGGGLTPTVPGGPGPEDVGSEPAVSIGTTVADVPVAVDIGEDPGVTVGPIEVGSAPEPGEDTVSVGGPLEPLAPVVEPISGALGG